MRSDIIGFYTYELAWDLHRCYMTEQRMGKGRPGLSECRREGRHDPLSTFYTVFEPLLFDIVTTQGFSKREELVVISIYYTPHGVT
jgi:hypothetical protein